MRFVAALCVCVLAVLPTPAAPTTPDAFIAAIKSAIAAKSSDQLLALTYTAGMSDADKKQMASRDRTVYFSDSVTGITLGPLPGDFQSVDIANGKKNELTALPKGVVVIHLTTEPGEETDWARITLAPYTIIGGGYYLLGSKSTDLGWKGPSDKTLSFMVTGGGPNGVQIHVTWNASGVEQERTFKTGNMGHGGQYSDAVTGQYFETVTVTCADPNADLTLELKESGNANADLSPDLMDNGQDIVPPIKGKGTITYKKWLRA